MLQYHQISKVSKGQSLTCFIEALLNLVDGVNFSDAKKCSFEKVKELRSLYRY